MNRSSKVWWLTWRSLPWLAQNALSNCKLHRTTSLERWRRRCLTQIKLHINAAIIAWFWHFCNIFCIIFRLYSVFRQLGHPSIKWRQTPYFRFFLANQRAEFGTDRPHYYCRVSCWGHFHAISNWFWGGLQSSVLVLYPMCLLSRQNMLRLSNAVRHLGKTRASAFPRFLSTCKGLDQENQDHYQLRTLKCHNGEKVSLGIWRHDVSL